MSELVNGKIEHVLLCYAVLTDLHTKLESSLTNLETHHGLPQPDFLHTFLSKEGMKLILFEDLVSDMVQNREINNLFMVHAHHSKTICCYTSQNLFMSGVYARDLSYNTHLFFLLNTARNYNSIRTFATQLTGNTKQFKSFLGVWNEKIRPFNYSYLLVNCAPGTPQDFRLCTDIFKDKITRFFLLKLY